ncbi:hypothetical protein SGRA_2944 [Saprospira grandis str. Lewin]|uniref:Uncharacterized protein n=1 Tax=Saprospira grandis (strain Lewin) TaxID=984262 RepID=H6LAS9_SAPGL|nr:hypothetical protein SGRA_2944 [Saprospira grandis str. Lewin]
MAKAARLNLAEGWKGGRRSRRPKAGIACLQGRAKSEPRHSPTRADRRGAAPKKQ